ncbi:uncharacterized protein LOC113068424 isoform X3 [Tachysurus ichikawai]
MVRQDSSLPQVIYANTEFLGRESWSHNQVLADQFGTSFIHYYLPASWPVGRVVRLLPSQNGRVRVSEININDKTYVRPVAKLIQLPKIDD